ncbi:MAG: DUF6064 family protein [Marinobacter sp.]|uniref:DUF6064 family protein n=1 Tax=Marinobacter sp. TaxID=50741 RepID=UPI00299F2212|nr:DUF6064 family protein [Marinobacter sp.]MDX1634910.1 DUF6064 family protein [Marinobacter sp.]
MTWDYALSDLVMFTPEVYLRLFVRFNEAVWPLQLVALVAGLAIPLLLTRATVLARKLAVALLALAWIFTGLGFTAEYYAPINWPVTYFGYAFVAQAMVTAAVAGAWRPPARLAPAQGRGRLLLVLWALVLLVLPWLTPATAGEASAIALFGLTPDVTATGSLLLAPLLTRAWRWLLVLLPLLWCLFSLLTLYTLGLALAMLVPLAGILLALVVLPLPDPE